MSSLVSIASSNEISGLGFAIAKTIGLSAIDASISFVIVHAADRPRKRSAPFTACCRVSRFLLVMNSCLYLFRSFLFVLIIPFESAITIFDFLTPRETYTLEQEIAD